MTESEPSHGREWTYRFRQPDGVEIAVQDLNGDDAAERVARELSKSAGAPVIVQRLQKAANSWEYVIEVDERHDT
jgi:hypothetical protein